MCGVIFNRHDWEELNNRRVCRKCGAKQVLAGSFDGYYWQDVTNCPECGGNGNIFTDKFEKVVCPTCKGSGKS